MARCSGGVFFATFLSSFFFLFLREGGGGGAAGEGERRVLNKLHTHQGARRRP